MSDLPSPLAVKTETASDEQMTDVSNVTVKSDSRSPTTLQYPAGYFRRTHKKSRTGCKTCKARKIKCDERKPACLNCIGHGVECPFLTASSQAGSGQSSSTTPTPKPAPPTPPVVTSPPAFAASPMRPTPPPSEVNDELPLLELELLHNFSVHTYSTLAADSGVCDFWRVTVVEIGLRCDYIMRAVLAVSALHLGYHRPDKRDVYTAHAIMLHQKASRSAMKFMAQANIEKDDAVNLFLFSMLTVYFALASPRRLRSDGSFFIGITEAGFPDWTYLIHGAKSLSNVLGDKQGHDTVLRPFLEYGQGRWNAVKVKRDEGQQVPELLGDLRHHIRESVHEDTNESLLKTYMHAIDELELSLIARQDPESPRDVLDAMLWLWEVSHSLVPLLKVPTQEAVAIFAHFCMLLKHHESQWWLQGWGDHLISRAHEILDEEHRPWIAWPMREVGWTAPPPTSTSRFVPINQPSPGYKQGFI